jgi:hypothetical protein
MRKLFLPLIIVPLLLSCERDNVSDIQAKYFLKHYDITYLEDVGYDLQLTPEGGYIFIGTSENKELNKDIVLIKVDKYGNQSSWSPLLIGGTGNDYGTAVAVDENGYIITGSIDGRMALKKIGNDGEEIWSTSYVNTGLLNDVDISDNRIYVVGYETSVTGWKPFRAVFDSNGVHINSSIPTFSQFGDYFTSLAQDGAVSNCFGTQIRDGQNISIIRHGAEGSFSSEETVFDESGDEISSRVNPASSGGFFIIGTFDPIGVGQSLIFLRKLNSDYSVNSSFSQTSINTIQLNLEGDFRGVDVREMADGNIAVLGDRTASNDINIILYILSPEGTVRSYKMYGSSGDQTASSLDITDDNGLIILGSSKYQGNSMITLIKADPEGEIWE